jgi:hypothetical protein
MSRFTASEWQRALNCIFEADGGEQNFGGLGQVRTHSRIRPRLRLTKRIRQITAIFVSVAPLWSLAVALYRYPALHRKRQRLQRTSLADNAHAADETAHLLRPSVELTPIQQHLLLPSDETLRNSSDLYEMDIIRPTSVHNCTEDHSPPSLSFSSSLPSSYHLPAPPTQELHHHRTSSLKRTATRLAVPETTGSGNRLGSHGGTSSISGITSLNRRPVHRPRGPRDGAQRSPSSPEFMTTWDAGRGAGSWMGPSYV